MNKMNFQRNQFIPLSQQQDPHQDQPQTTIRKRLPSLSLKSMTNYSSPATSWAFRRSKSVSSMFGNMGSNSITKWWESGWAWILSRKPAFAFDLEMSEAENKNKGSWKHVLYKLSSEIKKIVGGGDKTRVVGKYGSVSNYFKNNYDNRRNTLPY